MTGPGEMHQTRHASLRRCQIPQQNASEHRSDRCVWCDAPKTILVTLKSAQNRSSCELNYNCTLPELRKDPVTGRWVIIATDRARPSEFLRAPVVAKAKDGCPFCAGHEDRTPPEILSYRDGADKWNLRVVPNKFPALRVEGTLDRSGEGLYDKMSGIGAHEVIIECPEHKVSLAQLPEKNVEDLFWAFRDRIQDLKRDTRLRYVLLFKNHGEAAGASLEHSHSQLIALPVVPVLVQEEIDGGRRYFEFKERCVYCDMLRQEASGGTPRHPRNRRNYGAGALRRPLSVRNLGGSARPQFTL